MYIYGGHDIREGSMDTLWMLDLSKLSDLEKPESQQDKKSMWHMLEASGKDVPGALSHHTSVVFNDKMFLLGGSRTNGDVNNELFSLDLKSFKWDIVHTVNCLIYNYIIERSSTHFKG